MGQLFRNRRFWVVVVIIVGLLASIHYSSKELKVFNKIENAVISIFKPVQKVFF